MRGTPGIGGRSVYECRIIPAYAGNTRHTTGHRSAQRDHPRICGEHYPQVTVSDGQQGSSPHMRGTRHRRTGRGPVEGIIPAYAGNTRTSLLVSRSWRDHPRICGEHSYTVGALGWATGSSPHMRGTRLGAGHSMLLSGIIPAYAGNTLIGIITSGVGRDHPRICGEHWWSLVLLN